jgi:hypothetical protein
MRRDFWRNLELDWSFKDEDLVRKQNWNTDGTKGKHFAIIPDWMTCGSQNEEFWKCGVRLMAKHSSKERLDWLGMKDLQDRLRWRVLFGINGGLGSLIPRVSKLRSRIGSRWWSEFRQVRDHINIFILLIRFNHSTYNARPIRPHKIKSVAHYYRLRESWWQNALANVFYWFNASHCTGKRWIMTTTIFTLVHHGPIPKYPTHAYTKHNQENKA